VSSFFRHICIDFPAFDDYRPGSAKLQEDSIQTLEVIREQCTGIGTLQWRKRWENLGSTEEMIAANSTIKRNYVWSFDVLFGIWQTQGLCWFHDGWLGNRLDTNNDQRWNQSRWALAEATAPR